MDKDALLALFLQSNSLNALVEATGMTFGCPVLVVDNAFHIVSAYAAADFDDPDYHRAVRHSELPLALCAAIGERLQAADATHITLDAAGRRCRVAALHCADVALGYILYLPETDVRPAERDCLFAEQLLAKQFYLERHAGEHADTAEDILGELLDERFSSEEIFRLTAAGTYLAHFHPVRFALIDGDIPPGEAIDRLRRELAGHFAASHPIVYDGCILTFLHEDHDLRPLYALSKTRRLRVMVSGRLDTLYALPRVYRTARAALHYRAAMGEGSFVAYSDDYALLMLLRDTAAHSAFGDDAIDALYRHDRDEGSALCLTLYTYLICRHSLSATGARLFTHRNTVQYRLRLIREEFAVDPDDPDRCFRHLLALALALLRLGQEALFLPPATDALPEHVAD